MFENEYQRLSEKEHIEMHHLRNEMQGIRGKDTKEYINAFCNRKFMSDFCLEMNRSAGEYLRKFRGTQQKKEK